MPQPKPSRNLEELQDIWKNAVWDDVAYEVREEIAAGGTPHVLKIIRRLNDRYLKARAKQLEVDLVRKIAAAPPKPRKLARTRRR